MAEQELPLAPEDERTVAPRLQVLIRWTFAAMEKRRAIERARSLAFRTQQQADADWCERYERWWQETGWKQGAPRTADAYAEVLRTRRPA
jgi:hypothetical protein